LSRIGLRLTARPPPTDRSRPAEPVAADHAAMAAQPLQRRTGSSVHRHSL